MILMLDGYFDNLGDILLLTAILQKLKVRSTKVVVKCCNCEQLNLYLNTVERKRVVLLKWCNPLIPPLPYVFLANEIIVVGGKYLGNLFEWIYLFILTLFAKIIRRKIFFMSVGFYPGRSCTDVEESETPAFNKMLFKLVITLADNITVRGHISKRVAESIIGKSINIELDPLLNASFFVRSMPERREYVVLVLKNLNIKYFPKLIANLVAFVKYLYDKTKYKIACVDSSDFLSKGLKLCELIKIKSIGYEHLEDRFFTVGWQDLLKLLCNAIFAVIIGYHASIVAVKCDIPSVSVLYELKIRELEFLCRELLYCKNIKFYEPSILEHHEIEREISNVHEE
ncbi:MAG: polysaccharide pyruvyl transferase family protein [Candidatus Korarchaeota archaeon]